MAKVTVHTDIPYADLVSADDSDSGVFDAVTIDELLDEMDRGVGDADEFFDRMKKARIERRSSSTWDDDPLGISKTSRQVIEQHAGAFGNGKITPPPFDFWAAAQFLTSNTWHSRCVEIKAKIAAGLDWHILKREGIDPAEGEVTGKIRALFADPNDRHQEINDVAKCLFTDLEAIGNAWLEVVRDEQGEIVELWHVPAISVAIDARLRGYWQVGHFGSHFEARFFKRFGDLRPTSFEDAEPMLASETDFEMLATELIHFASYHPLGGQYGVPSWIAAALAIRENRAVNEYNADFFEHQTIPNKIIVFKGIVPDERTKKKLADYFEVGLKGRSHKPLVLSIDEVEEGQGIDITDLKIGTGGSTDGDFLGLGDQSRDEIIAGHGVPPQMLGIQAAGRLGGKGSEEGARRDFKSYTIEPMQTGFERIIRKTLIDGRIKTRDGGGQRVTVQAGFGVTDARLKLRDFDLSDQDATLNKAREMRSAVGMGLRTVNEARIEMNLPPVTDVPMADELWVQTSAGPLPLRAVDPETGPIGVAPEPEQSDDQIEDMTP